MADDIDLDETSNKLIRILEDKNYSDSKFILNNCLFLIKSKSIITPSR
jgi:hypothetical protein